MRVDHLLVALLPFLGAIPPVSAQTSRVQAAQSHKVQVSAEQQLADYLSLLEQVSPAAEQAARTYIAAVRLRCGLALDVTALRHALARDGGDPLLMGLIRAAATQDDATRFRLVAQMDCKANVAP
jgi:hypothetical protein